MDHTALIKNEKIIPVILLKIDVTVYDRLLFLISKISPRDISYIRMRFLSMFHSQICLIQSAIQSYLCLKIAEYLFMYIFFFSNAAPLQTFLPALAV